MPDTKTSWEHYGSPANDTPKVREVADRLKTINRYGSFQTVFTGWDLEDAQLFEFMQVAKGVVDGSFRGHIAKESEEHQQHAIEEAQTEAALAAEMLAMSVDDRASALALALGHWS